MNKGCDVGEYGFYSESSCATRPYRSKSVKISAFKVGGSVYKNGSYSHTHLKKFVKGVLLIYVSFEVKIAVMLLLVKYYGKKWLSHPSTGSLSVGSAKGG